MSKLVTDGKPVTIPRLPQGLEAYLHEDQSIAIWDPARQRHVALPKGYTEDNYRAALRNLGYETLTIRTPPTTEYSGKRTTPYSADVLSVARFILEGGSCLTKTPETALLAADMFVREGRFPNLDTPPHE